MLQDLQMGPNCRFYGSKMNWGFLGVLEERSWGKRLFKEMVRILRDIKDDIFIYSGMMYSIVGTTTADNTNEQEEQQQQQQQQQQQPRRPTRQSENRYFSQNAVQVINFSWPFHHKWKLLLYTSLSIYRTTSFARSGRDRDVADGFSSNWQPDQEQRRTDRTERVRQWVRVAFNVIAFF